jgi:rRNA maturation endonuclease Nob1
MRNLAKKKTYEIRIRINFLHKCDNCNKIVSSKSTMCKHCGSEFWNVRDTGKIIY